MRRSFVLDDEREFFFEEEGCAERGRALLTRRPVRGLPLATVLAAAQPCLHVWAFLPVPDGRHLKLAPVVCERCGGFE